MRFGSVCSGIEAASVAWKPLGWKCAFVSEIEPFPKRVLAHHYPNVPDLGDFTKIGAEHGPVDLLVGGTPCQSFSVAGLRAGLADPRGNLMLGFGALAHLLRARWIVWENVPGVLSSNGGRDFGTFLGMLEELGYGFAYAVLDAQFFGVAQRRKRVFVVGHSGGLWQRAAAVLFEPESLRGDPAPRREAGQRATRTLAARTRGGGGLGTDMECGGGLVPEVAGCLSPGAHPGGANGQDAYADLLMPVGPLTRYVPGDRGTEGTDLGHIFPAPAIAFHVTQDPIHSEEAFPCLSQGNGEGCGTLGVAVDLQNVAMVGDLAGTLDTTRPGRGGGQAVLTRMSVRRLTPRECERLQGFPDDYTAIPGAKDGPRYRALGNSMAVPVMRWIGRRIDMVDTACDALETEAYSGPGAPHPDPSLPLP